MGNSTFMLLFGVAMFVAIVAVSPVHDADAMIRGLEDVDPADMPERLFFYRTPASDEQDIVLPIGENNLQKRGNEESVLGKRVYLARVGKRQYYAARIG